MRRPSAHGTWTIVGFSAIAAVLAVMFFSATWQTGGDNARYYLLAKEILDGRGYVSPHLPDGPPETFTPPGFPLMLAGVMGVLGESVVVCKLANVVLYILAAVIVVLWLQRLLAGAPVLALCSAAIGMFPVQMLVGSSMCLSETAYLLLSYAVILLLSGSGRESPAWQAVLAGLLVGFTYLVRTAGLAMAAGVCLWYVKQRRWRSLALFVACVVLLAAPWVIRNWLMPGESDLYLALARDAYGDSNIALGIVHQIGRLFPSYLRAIPDNLFYQLFSGRELLASCCGGAFASAASFLALGLICVGYINRIMRWDTADAYWTCYWIMICVYPIDQALGRLVIPLLPMAAVYMVAGIRVAGSGLERLRLQRLSRVWVRGVSGAAAVLVLGIALGSGIRHFLKERALRAFGPWHPSRYLGMHNDYMDAFARYVEAASWIGSNTAPESVVASRVPQQVAVMAGRRGWRYDFPEVEGSNAWDRMQIMARTCPTLILQDAFPVDTAFGKPGRTVLDPLITEHADSLKLLYSTAPPATHVWRVEVPAPIPEPSD
ncbi:MAG: hypothetical protein JXQ75_09905 [Phycisphaerae bacterium]|nr:hypothetical protein [Phycisphaerae bacterium]